MNIGQIIILSYFLLSFIFFIFLMYFEFKNDLEIEGIYTSKFIKPFIILFIALLWPILIYSFITGSTEFKKKS